MVKKTNTPVFYRPQKFLPKKQCLLFSYVSQRKPLEALLFLRCSFFFEILRFSATFASENGV